MSVRFDYDPEQQLLLLTYEGELRDEDLVTSYRKARQFSAHHPVRFGILNGLAVTSVSISAERVKSLAHHASMLPEDSDRCIVVDQDFIYGMARMYQMLGGESRERLRVVRTLQEAYDHLHIAAPAQLQPIVD